MREGGSGDETTHTQAYNQVYGTSRWTTQPGPDNKKKLKMQRIEVHYILLSTHTFKTANFLMGLQVVKVPASIKFENVLVTDDRQTDRWTEANTSPLARVHAG